MNYELELEKVSEKIRQEKAKIVCIQLPDGLRPRAKELADKLEKETGAEIIIWQGSCFGACDLPIGLEKLGVDLLVQWGHSEWKH